MACLQTEVKYLRANIGHVQVEETSAREDNEQVSFSYITKENEEKLVFRLQSNNKAWCFVGIRNTSQDFITILRLMGYYKFSVSLVYQVRPV